MWGSIIGGLDYSSFVLRLLLLLDSYYYYCTSIWRNEATPVAFLEAAQGLVDFDAHPAAIGVYAKTHQRVERMHPTEPASAMFNNELKESNGQENRSGRG